MPLKSRFAILFAFGPMLCVCFFACAVYVRARDADPKATSQTYGRYSAEQIVRRTEPIYQALNADRLPFSMTPTLLFGHDQKASELRWKWLVECSDPQSNVRSVLQWDAHTGLLEKVSQKQAERSPSSKPISHGAALEAAWEWLVRLYGTREGGWRLKGEPEYVNERWQYRFAGGNIRVFLSLAASDGQLVAAHATSLSQPPREVPRSKTDLGP
jgi:hypothetical protein